MSLDGSFRCDAALKLLLARIPMLQSNPHLSFLSGKGDKLTADDVVGALAEPFLHPCYTIPIIGCFRPFCRRIVDKVIELLRHIPALGEDMNKGELEELREDDFCVIDFYVRRKKGLLLHEAACMALCRVIDLSPFVMGTVLNYFKYSPPPFQRFSFIKSGFLPSEQDIFLLTRAIRISFRLLLMAPKEFSKLWNWSTIVELVQNSAYGLNNLSITLDNILDIKWCMVQIVAVVLRMSDRATTSFGLQADESLACFFRWDEFCQDTAIEKASWYFQANKCEASKYSDQRNTFCGWNFFGSQLSSLHLCSKGMRSNPREHSGFSDSSMDGSGFVLTSALQKSYEMVLMAISQKWPVLLHGPPGVGKTALINMLSATCGSKVLFIHMDDHMDSKTLIGSYICAERPGEFRWQPGSLTQAVVNGLWVVFEDIDKAPSEVQSTLLPLLEGSSSFAVGTGEAVNIDERFRLFATISNVKEDFFHGKFNFSGFWRKVMVGIPSREDMMVIVNERYPCLMPCTMKVLDTFEKVNSIAYNTMGVFESSSGALSCFSMFSLRHLLKFCKRIADLGCHLSGDKLLLSDCRKVFLEAADIFASFSASTGHRLFMKREIAKIWDIPLTEAERLYPHDKPIVESSRLTFQVGRATLQTLREDMYCQSRSFVNLRRSLHILEKIACCVMYNEPVLLVGETGTGKTTLVQNVASRLGQQLIVLNLSQQSDVADLLGGFKPSDACSICVPLHHEFVNLFCRTFKKRANENRLHYYEKYIMEKKWKLLLSALQKCVHDVYLLLLKEKEASIGTKRKRSLDSDILEAWEQLSVKLNLAQSTISGSSGIMFSFVEGAFVKALRNGHWILLDEVNLAPPEILQRLTGVLDGEDGALVLAERGDISYVDRHSCFRLFACMNPATDAGKRDLPQSFRSRFTEFFVDDLLDEEDLYLFVSQCMDGICCDGEKLRQIVHFYNVARNESELHLQDGANQKPQFSLRSLSRALEYTRKAEKKFGFERALYDGFCMFFLTLLDITSGKIMKNMILKILPSGRMPSNVPFDHYFTEQPRFSDISLVDGYMENYVLTESVKGHLGNIARAVYIKRYPVLLQGPTSSGKTSLVQYLASVTGHQFVRINNHDHTDLQEYLGSYITNSFGSLEFQEGALVKAVRMGYWIVLDELNLAPSEVLEALNRLLDDNRELFVPELQETISAHPDFMLFATQNPPTLYGGRKMLSRAFRNRFLEIHVDEIPETELSTILEKRCKIPKSHATKMVDIFKDLQRHRQNSKVFAGKHGFITPRDLFKWANRFRMFGKSYEDLAKDGYFLLAERLREENERKVVQEILEQRFHVKLLLDNLYPHVSAIPGDYLDDCKLTAGFREHPNVVWTKSMCRLLFLVERCCRLHEPVLLVGDTGGGKTTVCQFLSAVLGRRLHTLNCHQYTESSDFIGGFHPVRDRSGLVAKYKGQIEKLKLTKAFQYFEKDFDIKLDIDQGSSTFAYLNELGKRLKKESMLFHHFTEQDLRDFEHIKLGLVQIQQEWRALFFWQDGPLVQAMKEGDLFLLDEISLADDSVLERLNSVLEPERTLCLAEKGGSFLEKIQAHQNFLILATMNPGGDYGKKELSPALRNRFTEIWVPPVLDIDELRDIALQRFYKSELSLYGEPMLKFWDWFNQIQAGRLLTVRDLLSWIDFLNETEGNLGSSFAFIHGAFLVLLDGLNLGTGMSKYDAAKLRLNCFSFLLEQLKLERIHLDPMLSKIETYGWGDVDIHHRGELFSDLSSNHFGIKPFFISKGCLDARYDGFEFLAPTTGRNTLRLLRAMQLSKPVLLEGSPGVGKTSLVLALARYSGHPVVRINLSEQTDMMDLLGSDLPVDNENQIEFAWSSGVLLQAIVEGSWVLLDELNLAPQSVLEGLNAILDHRGTVYIPELGRSYTCKSSFRIFACQNPSSQGGGRKGLPKSFLNRFTKVYVDELGADDYLYICRSLYSSIPPEMLGKLIAFNNRIYEEFVLYQKYGQVGSPWEFNLRDILRSCQIMKDCQGAPDRVRYESFLNVVYGQRMRTVDDRQQVMNFFGDVFGIKPLADVSPKIHITPQCLAIGSASIARNYYQPVKFMKNDFVISTSILQNLEAILHCIKHQWLCILVGPSSSGKTSMIRFLAQVTGNSLNELNLSSGTDVSELLGCFEQYNAFNCCKMIISDVERYVYEYCSVCLRTKWEALINDRMRLINDWLTLLGSFGKNFSAMNFAAQLDQLVEIIGQLKFDLERHKLPVSWSMDDLNKSLRTIAKVLKNNKMQKCTKFEWVSGRLLKAIECGEWVVLDNANLCNPTVLDRINSLVEPDGLIIVNESGLIDGKPLALRPHSNFRIFLTFDPRYGEVSRAMRNRGVEIFVMEPCLLLQKQDANTKVSIKNDLKRLLVMSGIPQGSLIDIMTEAHIYARESGVHHGVDITLLELSRWVQLFQELLMSGNQPKWSLQLSWEHTYLSSLGEAARNDVIEHIKNLYLSGENVFDFGSLQSGSLFVPGGWPVPLNIRYLTWFSREASIKQNFLYLEFLCAQVASYELNNKCNGLRSICDLRKFKPSFVPVQLLYGLLFPNLLGSSLSMLYNTEKFSPEMAHKMLQFAANWAFEQATPSDFDLYMHCIEWYNSEMQPYSSFLNSYVSVVKNMKDHPIWKCIYDCWFKITHYFGLDNNDHQLPLLSYELVELACSNRDVEIYGKLMHEAVDCVNLLHLSFEQWIREKQCISEKLHPSLLGLLKCLRYLEEDALSMMMDSSFLDQLVNIYPTLLDHHTAFWRSITNSQHEHSAVAWNLLKKEVLKLQNILPDRVNSLLAESLNLNKFSNINFDTTKPMLWLYGGHPLLPKTTEEYGKVHQLLTFCNTIFPGTMKLWKQACDNKMVIDIALATDVEVRHLVMKGICMPSFISVGVYPCNVDTIQEEELYLSLLRRYEHERSNLLVLTKPEKENVLSCNISDCGCVLSPVSLCQRSGLCCWLATCIFSDWNSFSLDIEVLQQLSQSIVLSSCEVYKRCSSISSLLSHALHYSLESSSRCPMDFAAHQKLLWLLDAWESVDSGPFFLGNFIHEMWFRWHSSLWTCYSEPFEKYIPSFCAEFFLLLQPMRIATIEKIQNCPPIVDYEAHSLKLRVVSRCLEEGGPAGRRLLDVLLSSAQALFQQIIFVHKKSFDDDKFRSLEILFSSMKKNSLTDDKINAFEELILCSRHKRLTSLAEIISPLLRELYTECASCDFLQNIGRAWLHVGVLRFYLLFNPDEPDPTFKIIFKHSQVLEKISMLELEAKVRQECENLAGRNTSRGLQEKRKCSLELYEQRQKKLRAKIVFRDGGVDYNSLKVEISGFVKLVCSCVDIAMGLGDGLDLGLLSNKVLSWQDTASNFISILSQKYSSYIDVIQPVQVAIYEMKLGLSLLLSDALQKEYLRKIEEKNIDRILETIDSFMRFPKYLPAAYSNNAIVMPSDSSFYSPGVSLGISTNLLTKMVGASNGNDSINMVTGVQMKASVYHITLFHLACSLCSSLIIDKNSFLMMNEIFGYFTNMWLAMKGEVKAKEETEFHNIKFRPRAIMVEDVLKVDSAIFCETDSEENIASQSDEILIDLEFTKWKASIIESKSLEDDWYSIQESILSNVVDIHNQLFGSSNLVRHPGIFQFADDDKLQFFADSYKLGIRIVKGLPAVLSSVIEENLVAEHLLHISYEYGKSQNVQRGASHVYNVYKESNAPMMSKMVKPLVLLQQRFKDLLEEWPDHPGLLKVIDDIDVLLHMPFSAPLSQALLGLHLLLNKAHSLKESFARDALKDVLHPMYCIVLSWQKLELDCWPSLLDEVQQQHEANAGKLWFALNSVLQQNISGDFHDIIQSMEDFIQMSSIGEFQRRLQLVLAFHGQINTGISLKAYASQHKKDYLHILYNIFGYYIQFLPLIMEQIDNERKCIEKELIQHLKLFKWAENECSFLSIENFRKIRQKSLKLVKKYNDVLQKPIMVILKHETSLQRNKYSAWLEQKSFNEMNTESVPFPTDIIKFSNIERFSWYNVWKHKFLNEESSKSVKSLYTTEILDHFGNFQSGWEGMWIVLEKICHNAAEFAEVWKNENKNLKKRRTLADLFKNLEKCGLSRHRFLTCELEFGKNQQRNSFLQSSFDVWHLLLMEGASEEKCGFKWITANQYYFKNLAMKQHLGQISLNFHKDLTMEQVHRGSSFLDHLLQIQQEQRSVLYMFSEKLNALKKCLTSMEHIGTGNGSLSPFQHAFVDCMWKQKNIFDNLHSLSCDISLILHCVGGLHTNNCNAVQTKINFCSLIQRYIPSFLHSKELLAKHLLGRCGVISASKFVSHTIISKEIEDFVMQNFQLINRFGKHIEAFHMSNRPSRSTKMLLNRFEELCDKGVMALDSLQIELGRSQCMEPFVDGSILVEILLKHKHEYAEAYNDANQLVSEASKKLLSPVKCESVASLAADISSWKVIFESYIANLNLDHLHDALTKLLFSGVRLLSYYGHEKSEVCSQVEMHFKDIYAFLDNIVTIGDGILSEMLSVHCTVAEMSYMLGHIFASLFSKGFGVAEVKLDDTNNGRFQDATGTGLGEGEGLNDVSDQIDDAAQIPDVSDENGEGLEKSSKIPGTDEKGIEIDEDFTAEMSGVSDDSNDDEGKEEDIHPESLMGENTEGSEAIKEKPWDNDEDGCQGDPKEKYENGSSIEEKDSGYRELRAKDDKTEAVDDSPERHDENDRANGEVDSTCSLGDEENFSDMDKSNAFEETSGIQINDQEDGIDTTDETDEPPCSTEETDEGKHDAADEPKSSHMDEETEISPNDMDKYDSNAGPADKVDEDAGEHNVDNETNEGKEEISDKLDLKSMGMNEASIHQGMVESSSNHAVGTDTLEAMDFSHIDESNITSSIHQPNSTESFLSPFSGLSSFDVSKMESSLSDSTGNLKVEDSQQKSRSDNQCTHRIHPNPYRSIGDALKEWKERVKISSDTQELGKGIPENMNDEDADEYRFISEEENGISQVLGPAMAEQVANDIEPMELDADRDRTTKQMDDVDMADVLNEDVGKQRGGMSDASTLKPEIEKHETLVKIDLPMEDPCSNISKNSLGDFVSLESEFMNDKCSNDNLLSGSHNVWKPLESESVSDEMDRAVLEWRRYEFVTTKLSQVLAEQLRLVMEPTLASKLQGDYKTGKRINMKKVIPYIASHFRKDKIWLRRTRPNKRDYQVVVAIDDSRSMSESHCGNVALEALITICRAMSQLEVGQLAVTSFGEKGNIRLLHGFDQPFTGEAGVKMISSLSFKQENTILDEPMVDLLMYLNSMLDSAVAKARLPSGNSPLQQLILIIADGRFHEKEKLKRYVRDVLNRKRMIAFILLDSPLESIMDLMEASFQGVKLTFTKYMNSFPFPYYVVLRDVEALPRTLADLLRQWFELMQNSANE